MKQQCFNRIIALSLVLAIVFSNVQSYSIKAESDTEQQVVSDESDFVNETISNNYTNVSNSYTTPVYTGAPIKIRVDEAFVGSESNGNDTNKALLCSAKDMDETYAYENEVLNLTLGSVVTLRMNVPQTGRYVLKFDYISWDDSILPIEMAMQVNGEFPFYEARRLLFETTWVSKSETSYDRYGKEIVTVPDKLKRWENKYLKDASYRRSMPLILELHQGINEFTFHVSEGSLLLGNLTLEAPTSIPEEKLTTVTEGENIIVLQGESFTYRNDSSIRSVAEYDADVAPYEVKDTILNTVDSASFKKAGQKITYEFSVPTSGYYNIAVNYRQSDKTDFPVFVDVAIDGEIKSLDFKAYPLAYTTKYKTSTMVDENGDKLSVYLEPGVHSISYTINIDNIRHVLESVDRIMSEINDLSLEITKVAGTNKDKYRDLKLTRYIPDVKERLDGWADELDQLHDSVKNFNPKVDRIAAFSAGNVAATQLRSLSKDPDELIYRVAELSSSINSINTQLANLIDSLNKNNLAIDRIYLYQKDAKLPTKVGFFTKVGLSVQRFFYSFFNQSYSTSNVNKEHLQVWVNRSRQHVEIMQKMIDEEFTKETGIQVDLSIMPDQNKLVLANSSGDQPDIATGINYAIPFELGVRGAIKNLAEFDDFKEVASNYAPGLLLSSTIEDGIYGLPETMNFWVLFYRTDVLNKLGLSVPNTMEDVLDMLPELQMRGLNFYYPTAGMLVMRNYHGTTPLLFQNGASLYTDFVGKTALNTEEAIKGFTTLTELFTIYNLPIDIPNFYQHFRNGDLPIGIADYAVYNLLVNAAPEIANSWEISIVPGIEQENGEILRYTAGGAESTVMFHSDVEREEKAWEFMKWWSSTEVQTKFGQTLQISYGDEYLWNTANLNAFLELPWDSVDKQIIKEQATHILEAPRVLGSYMLEREVSNAFNDIVVNGKNLRTRIDTAVKIVDRETMRKLEEFGYIVDGDEVKEYKVPTIDIVNKILGTLE